MDSVSSATSVPYSCPLARDKPVPHLLVGVADDDGPDHWHWGHRGHSRHCQSYRDDLHHWGPGGQGKRSPQHLLLKPVQGDKWKCVEASPPPSSVFQALALSTPGPGSSGPLQPQGQNPL
ncbi:putative ATP-dependent RNA helicase DHX57 [Platysternon megacephalum]|uniref:Putative ATP-dependent RNA helicase DHX57 n=1 Tax=Platysternon megacephalum TaxID=55544 RepID=A0A4D9DJI8_9SAUR|nr:putative ATP-dependent RNA helicase DHX57 [Platysternon megacephalum]